MDISTKLIKLGVEPSQNGGCVMTPIYKSSTLLFKTVEELEAACNGISDKPYYGRHGTPTVEKLEEILSELEGSYRSVVTSSGASAYSTALTSLLDSGDHILMTDNVYSPARKFCTDFLSRMGIETDFFNPKDMDALKSSIKENTKLIYIESPGSLTFEVTDIEAVSKICKEKNVILMADTTWSALINSRPFKHGIDVTIHSGTKYISGHSDVLMGVIGTSDRYYEKILSGHRALGAIPSPETAYLALRGLKTLKTRLKAHEEASVKIADWLQNHQKVERVFYPVMENDPEHELYKKYFTGGCGLFSFMVKKSEKINEFFNSLKLFGMGFSWGGFESLVTPVHLPQVRTHEYNELDGDIIRLHIGLEDPHDLIADLEQGLQKI